jgi:nicotinate-nucleotide adenylyltransferase
MSAPRDAARRPRIGLFGGSFDPVHAGHLHVARAAQERFGLDRVVFVPAARSPFKPGRQPAPGEHRRAMLRLALEGEPSWSESGLELERGGTSWTIDTVRSLPQALGVPEDSEIFLLIGSDNLPALPEWRESRALLERVQPVVIFRDGVRDAQIEPVRRAHGDALAKKVEQGYLELPPVAVSSTEIRERLERGERDVEGVPPAVLEYIRAHGLYGARA